MKFSELREMFRRQAELTEKVLNGNPKDKEQNEKLQAELFELNWGIRQILANDRDLFVVEKDMLIGAINDAINSLDSGYSTRYYNREMEYETLLVFEGGPISSKSKTNIVLGPLCFDEQKFVNLRYLLDHSRVEKNEARKILSSLCPGIEDVLWGVVRERLNKERKSRMTYIQNMIAQNEDKIAEINRPKYVETETEKLEKGNIHLQQELSSINEEIDEIE